MMVVDFPFDGFVTLRVHGLAFFRHPEFLVVILPRIGVGPDANVTP